jgi:hypothetical protein
MTNLANRQLRRIMQLFWAGLAFGLLAASGCAWGDTEVGGAISQDTVWGPGSPTEPDTVYIVVGDVDVLSGVTLTIEPGVTVRLGKYLSIIVHGRLVAEGGPGEGDLIFFTSDRPDPAPGDWMRLRGATSSSISLAHCVLEYGGGSTNAMFSTYNSDIDVVSSDIRFSASDGIEWGYGSINVADLRIEDCDVHGNAGRGIYMWFQNGTECSPAINGCRVGGNGSIGISCTYLNASSGSPVVTSCDVTGSGTPGSLGYGGEGIRFTYQHGSLGSPVIADCVLTSNLNEGIECYYNDASSGDPTIRDCTVVANKEDGIQCLYEHSSGTVHVTGCYIEGCEGSESGIEVNHYYQCSGGCDISDCTLVNNGNQADHHINVDYQDRSAGATYITACRMEHCRASGLVSNYGQYCWGPTVITDCTITDTTSLGMRICYGGADEGSSILIDSCSLSACAWSGVSIGASVPVTLSRCLIAACGGRAVELSGCEAEIVCCTLASNSSSGVQVSDSLCSISSTILAYNHGCGVNSTDESVPEIWYSDFWANDGGAMSGDFPGEGNIFEDPEFLDREAGDYHLTCASPCIDSGDPDAPSADGTRIDMGAFQFGGTTAAPEPEPYGSAPLFGDPSGGYPGWVWFSVPFYPCGSAEPPDVLGFACAGRVFRWDKYGKFAQVYQPPFLSWDLVPGESYVLYHTSPVANPCYLGGNPAKPFEFRLGRQGWTWLGMPANAAITGQDFMSQVAVRYPSDEAGEVRTAQEDYDATPGNWVAWGWAFFDTGTQSAKAFTPYAPFGNRDCHPWLGYRAWVKVGSALTEDDPDQVTLIWP